MFYKGHRVSKRMVEYWIDDDEHGKFIPIKIPYKYLIEMVADFIGAGKAYDNTQQKVWSPAEPQIYWDKCCEGKRLMHKDSLYLFKKLLWNLKEMNDEKAFYKWYKDSKDYLKENYEKGNKDY